MKSIHHGKAGANAKLRGKLTKLLSCGCCMMQNFKHSYLVKCKKQEIKGEKNE
jgi:hypothetical protein